MGIKVILALTFITCLSANAQQVEDSVSRVFFPQEYGSKKWKPIIGFDATRSFYSGNPVKINGLKFGAQYKGVYRFGFGFYGLDNDLIFKNINVQSPYNSGPADVKYKFNYAAFFFDRVFYRTKKLEVSLPVYLGAGGIEGFVQATDGNFYRYTASSFSLISFGIQSKYYVLPWLAPRLSTGYRLTFNADKAIRNAFNGPYYAYGLSFLVGELYAIIKQKKSTTKS